MTIPGYWQQYDRVQCQSCVFLFRHITLLMLYHPTVEFDPGCEAMIYSKDGTPLQGEPFVVQSQIVLTISQVSLEDTAATVVWNILSLMMHACKGIMSSLSNRVVTACLAFRGVVILLLLPMYIQPFPISPLLSS